MGDGKWGEDEVDGKWEILAMGGGGARSRKEGRGERERWVIGRRGQGERDEGRRPEQLGAAA